MRDCEARVRSLSDEAYRLRHALEVSEAGKDKLKARLAKLRTTGATLSKLPFDEADHLRNVLRRSRRQKTTIGRLHKENARLRKAVKVAKTGRVASEARLARLRTARKTLSAWMPSCAESCADRGAGRPRSSPCPVITPGCARARRRRATGSRRWKPISRGFAQPGPCCRGRSTAARASSRRRRALRAPTRPAARRARPRPHPAARPR